MADVRSKNLYELLGNDPELDPNREPEPPTRALDRPAPRVGKRDVPKEAPSQPRLSENNARRGARVTGNEAAFRDRQAGSRSNRDKPVDEGKEPQRRAFHARGERGDRFRNDRQSRTGQVDTRKQVNQGWGAQSGEKAGDKAWDDERAAEAIAQNESEPQTPAGEEPAEPADKTKSYADYLAEKAAQGDLSAKPVRSANEGSSVDKKWAAAKELKRGEEEEAYIKGKEEKSKREKQRKEKNVLEVDMRFVEAPRGGNSNTRGRGGRGGRGARGGRGGNTTAPRAEQQRGAASVTVDEKNFPSLGGK
ncbi:putative telomere and ribosome associated protein Stm1 [Aspergillus clavatus NRRL 1]|uniref:Telomere and ribosome associated protein Stm1, putative n=1 Tax=Aspergillus clavatus (strain ATCC 1007 / CBS 513.65 / DSM 816 / NCTC 3887 / NRRL 1 / QM 1276 / 107) TaxID=344612 RepID=A1CKJ3_ASPCL|nr:telomere and ribosome associated protein Stm1, putative [Aspergillus clavatus NRRL 1]EAW09667.1 telomere and ribosome associated protein Stm1, putative [Aspergillus clavatus NRRL 1]